MFKVENDIKTNIEYKTNKLILKARGNINKTIRVEPKKRNADAQVILPHKSDNDFLFEIY